jgi:hypothetical protein
MIGRNRQWHNLSCNLRGSAVENHYKPQLDNLVSGPRCEPGTSRIRRSANDLEATMGKEIDYMIHDSIFSCGLNCLKIVSLNE